MSVLVQNKNIKPIQLQRSMKQGDGVPPKLFSIVLGIYLEPSTSARCGSELLPTHITDADYVRDRLLNVLSESWRKYFQSKTPLSVAVVVEMNPSNLILYRLRPCQNYIPSALIASLCRYPQVTPASLERTGRDFRGPRGGADLRTCSAKKYTQKTFMAVGIT
ncbi:hypothetical protein EVAR_99802_1 [Eumeta japonica]|uniref:Uncharacterized protein n=1 Tax=Eumeta variegata TaxID=151549 RepID=A0A4C1ZD62_EUMVA|nr:hypothetical protein EVAR_99802_1 [Eumeta japonica]